MNKNPQPQDKRIGTGGGAFTGGNVDTDGGDFVGRDKNVQGDEIVGNKIEGDQIDARDSKGFVNRPIGSVIQHYGDIINIDSLKLPNAVALIVTVSGVLVLMIIGIIAYNMTTISGVVTATNRVSTATPPPTATPLAFATAGVSEDLILIATFFVSEGNRDALVHREIRNKIQEIAKSINAITLRVEIEPTVLSSEQVVEAELLGRRYRASIVIWGDDSGTRVTVNSLNLLTQEWKSAMSTISETVRTQIANPTAYNQFIVDDLPRQLAFFVLFAIGQNYSSNGNTGLAIVNIEAAINSLRDESKPSGLAEAYFYLG